MRKLMVLFFIIVSLLLSACATHRLDHATVVSEAAYHPYAAIFFDPEIQRDFKNIRRAAQAAVVYEGEDGLPYLTDSDLRRLNVLSSLLIYRLSIAYHLYAPFHNIHTYIARNQYNSCYEYYNSMDISRVGTDCHDCHKQDSRSCDFCNQFIHSIQLHPLYSFIIFSVNDGRGATTYIAPFQLKNGEFVYLALEIDD